MFKYIKTGIIALSLLTIFSCDEDFLEIDNENQPNSEQALSSSDDLVSLLSGAANTAFNQTVGLQGVYTDAYADQLTSTNNYYDFWAFADQPRRQYNNNPTNGNLGVTSAAYTSYNVAVANSNAVIKYIEIDGNSVIDSNGVDQTNKILAAAKFIKGFSLGYLGMMYDQAFIPAPDSVPATDATAENLKPYSEVVAAAVQNIDEALAIYQANSSVGFDSLVGSNISNSDIQKIANSFAARFMINMPRTKAEAALLDYNTIYNYASEGITENFEPATDEEVFVSNYQDWSLYVLYAGQPTQAGYLPSDNKIFYLMQNGNTYEPDYIYNQGVPQPEITSDDARLEEYYTYTTGLGFLNPDRNANLLTNYFHTRYWSNNNEYQTGLPIQMFMKAENDLIMAECKGMMRDMAGAASIINQTPRTTTGGLPNVSSSMSPSELEDVLHYEYSVELDKASGMGVHWAFMRRHDLLQAGTPLHWPIPGTQLEVLQMPIYTFGGAGNEGSASGANSWKN